MCVVMDGWVDQNSQYTTEFSINSL